MVIGVFIFFFFKQKTAYEITYGDWSSDVCSSDLLTLREVADVINMHESTVSRVTNEKYVQTPRGLLPLKFFFSSGLSTTTGEDASARAIRAQIQKMVGDEDPKNPLTDQQIVEMFAQRGVRIARRTVAKYRDQLGILPARMRSEERRVGKECRRLCRSRWSP